mmetsp:Transcript_6505/g.19282  ORF Transcript_6505/g.19282 Transcript_6505/m.19282 type:complete len:307 (+) Transcript_6505:61-981(+)
MPVAWRALVQACVAAAAATPSLRPSLRASHYVDRPLRSERLGQSSACVARARVVAVLEPDVQPTSMTVRQLKEELAARGLQAVADGCFERSELVSAVESSRLSASRSTTENSSSGEEARGQAPMDASQPPAPQETGCTPADVSAIRAELAGLRVVELRQRLAGRSLGWADLNEKSELVKRLADAVAEERRFSKSGRVPLGHVAELSEAEVREEIADPSSPLLLDVYAKWCGPCQMMAPFLETAAQRLRGRVRVVKVDSDAAERLSSELHIAGLPTLLAYRDGKLVHRAEGMLSTQQLIDLCDTHLL